MAPYCVWRSKSILEHIVLDSRRTEMLVQACEHPDLRFIGCLGYPGRLALDMLLPDRLRRRAFWDLYGVSGFLFEYLHLHPE